MLIHSWTGLCMVAKLWPDIQGLSIANGPFTEMCLSTHNLLSTLSWGSLFPLQLTSYIMYSLYDSFLHIGLCSIRSALSRQYINYANFPKMNFYKISALTHYPNLQITAIPMKWTAHILLLCCSLPPAAKVCCGYDSLNITALAIKVHWVNNIDI